MLKTLTRVHHQSFQTLTRDKQLAVQKTTRNLYLPLQVIVTSVNQTLTISMFIICLLQKQLKEYDKAIEKQLGTITHTFTLIKGVGNIYATGIIVKINDVNRFPNQASIARFAYLIWIQHQSSNIEAKDTKLIKLKNRHLQY